MTAVKRLAGWMLALLMAMALCVTPARADIVDPGWDERDDLERHGSIWESVISVLDDAEDDDVDDAADDVDDADDDVDDVDADADDADDDAEDYDGDGEIDDAEDEQLVEDVPAERKGGVPLIPLAVGVVVLAAGAATLIIRSGKARGE